MNTIQYAGIALSAFGTLLIGGWLLWNFFHYVDLPRILAVGLALGVCGAILVVASLIYERSVDVKKESFRKD
ncbi:MAG: hypothetical protein KO463_02175 [Candidatus Methanofastidiosa archaeon]|nr:hypothetical protein [Candidatus Methanofastidiosa archaeon]